MKLSEYAAKIAEVATKYPNAEVISSSDDEGNSFHPVYFDPTPGQFNDGEFQTEKGKKINAVCIN